jgi:hypothetical protein
MRSARAARDIADPLGLDRHPRFVKDTFQDCERLRIESHVAKLRHLALLSPSGALRGTLSASKEQSWLGGRKMWLSLFTICLVIAICLGVAATMSGFNKPG